MSVEKRILILIGDGRGVLGGITVDGVPSSRAVIGLMFCVNRMVPALVLISDPLRVFGLTPLPNPKPATAVCQPKQSSVHQHGAAAPFLTKVNTTLYSTGPAEAEPTAEIRKSFQLTVVPEAKSSLVQVSVSMQLQFPP